MRLFHLCSHRLSAVAWWIFPIFQSNHLLLRCFYSHPKGSAEITVLHCIKCDLPRGTFDWLKHGICGFFPCRRMKAHSNENSKQIQNTYLYQQSVEHLYLYIFSPMYVLLFFFIFLPVAVFFIYVWRFVFVYFKYYHIHFCCSSYREKLQGIWHCRWQWLRKWWP